MARRSTRPRGRPTVYTDAIADEILRRLEEGETLRAICRDEHLPPKSTVLGWVSDQNPNHAVFADRYARARTLGYRAWAEQIVEITDECDDSTAPAVQKAKLRVDTRKWLLAKMLPNEYGSAADPTTIQPADGVTWQITGDDGAGEDQAS